MCVSTKDGFRMFHMFCSMFFIIFNTYRFCGRSDPYHKQGMADVTSASGGMMVRQVTEENIDTARESYRPVAFRSSVWMVDVVDDGFPRRKCSSELLQLPSGDLTVHY